MVDGILDWLSSLPPVASYAVLMFFSALENVFPPVPADVAVALGAFLSQRGVTSAPLLGLLCWAANTTSAAGMYFLARARGPEFFESGWRRKLVPPEAMRALQEAYDKHGVVGIFLSRFLPGVRAAVTPFAGVVGMPPLRALVPAALASGIWYALLVSAGAALGLRWEAVRELVDRANFVLGLVATGATAAILFWLWRRVRA